MCVFDGKILKQMEGAAIVVRLAGELTGLFIVWWQNQFKRKMKREVIELMLFTRYVDDIVIVMRHGTEEHTVEEMMKKIQVLANTIHPSIRDIRLPK